MLNVWFTEKIKMDVPVSNVSSMFSSLCWGSNGDGAVSRSPFNAEITHDFNARPNNSLIFAGLISKFSCFKM